MAHLSDDERAEFDRLRAEIVACHEFQNGVAAILGMDHDWDPDSRRALLDAVDGLLAERNQATQQAQRYLEGAEAERERAASEARAVDTLRQAFREMREDRDVERGKRAQAEHERDTARRERDAHVHTLDHVLDELHKALGGNPEDASLATFPDALETVHELRERAAERDRYRLAWQSAQRRARGCRDARDAERRSRFQVIAAWESARSRVAVLEQRLQQAGEFHREVRDLQVAAAVRGQQYHLKAQYAGGEENVSLLHRGYEAFDFNVMLKELLVRFADLAPIELTVEEAREAFEDERGATQPAETPQPDPWGGANLASCGDPDCRCADLVDFDAALRQAGHVPDAVAGPVPQEQPTRVQIGIDGPEICGIRVGEPDRLGGRALCPLKPGHVGDHVPDASDAPDDQRVSDSEE
jgi:hypothetical protein